MPSQFVIVSIFSVLFLSAILTIPAIAAAPDIDWSKTYGMTGYSIITVNDGLIITGTSSGGHGGSDVCLLKTDFDGNLQWNKAYGGTSTDIGWSVAASGDGYVIIGMTSSFGEPQGDVYLVKTDLDGNMLWNKTFGESKLDCGYGVAVASDGYVITGYVNWDSSTHGDICIIKTDREGNVVWNKHYNKVGGEGKSIIVTGDGYVVGGSRDLSAERSREFYLLKTDINGNIIWENTYGSTREDTCFNMAAINGGYLLTGRTRLIGYGDPSPNIYDILLVKTDLNGNQLWSKALGTSNVDQGEAVTAVNNGYLIAGESLPRSDMNDAHLYLIKTDADGNIIWDKIMTGSDYRYCYSATYHSGACYVIGTYGSSSQTYLVKVPSDAQASTPTPTPVPTASSTPTATPTTTPAPSTAPTSTVTPTPSPTLSPMPVSEATGTPTTSITITPSPTPGTMQTTPTPTVAPTANITTASQATPAPGIILAVLTLIIAVVLRRTKK